MGVRNVGEWSQRVEYTRIRSAKEADGVLKKTLEETGMKRRIKKREKE